VSHSPVSDATADVSRDISYRALLGVPTLGRILLATLIARIAQSMVGVAIVLFTLETYGSPQLAGLVTFAALFPGLLVSPIAGALLDRHGRIRLVVLDYAVELVALGLIGGLALAHALPAPLLVLIAMISSFTAILSHTGLRSLFPLLAPEHLWERVNAVDSNGYVLATVIGPPLAAGLVSILGGATALVVIAGVFGLASLPMIGVSDPPTETASTGRLLVDAWQGVVYWWRNRTLRGLGFSITVLNIAFGFNTIVIPLVVLRVLGASELAVGLVFAASGVSGVVSALYFGRHDTRGREWRMLVIPMIALAPAYALMLPVAAGWMGLWMGLGFLVLSSLIFGFLNGPMDIALFTVRQRRTDPAWMGRAFAVSMAANFLGFPIGAAVAGALAAISLPGVVLLGVGTILIGAGLGASMIPRSSGTTP
jgi:predicted MFS family arabinose efflux permease